MRNFLLIMFFLLSSCVQSSNNALVKDDYSFSLKMSIEEFKDKLKEYAKQNPYPNID